MTRPSGGARTWTVVGVLIAAGAVQRTWNALHYPALMGFDATGNWEYIELLLGHFALIAGFIILVSIITRTLQQRRLLANIQ